MCACVASVCVLKTEQLCARGTLSSPLGPSLSSPVFLLALRTSPLVCSSRGSRLPAPSDTHLSQDLKVKLELGHSWNLHCSLRLKATGPRATEDPWWHLGQPLSLVAPLSLSFLLLSSHPLMVGSGRGEFPDLPALTKVTQH